MLNSMYNANYPPTYNHPLTQNPPVNNTWVHDQFSSNSTSAPSNVQHLQSQQMLLQQPSSSSINPLLQNQIGSSNFNNNINQQPMYHHPYYTSNQLQQTNASNGIPYNQQPATSSQFYPSTNNMTHHQQHVQNEVMPMESDNGDKFIMVNKKKKKKAKIDSASAVTPDNVTSSSSTSTSSINTDNSTSSTNSDSIVLNVHPPNRYQSKTITNINRTQTSTIGIISSNSKYNSIEISEQARRFAETRYAFPPFVIKFNQMIDEKKIIDFVVKHFRSEHKIDLNFAGHRLKNKNELLLFSDNRETFITLFDEQKWPTAIESMNYEKIIPKHLPPQFSIMLRNVPVDIEINSLLTNIKSDYPEVVNALRITGMNKKPSTLVRLDIQNISVIDNLLSKKFISYENLRLATTEYLAPAKVLICSKCFEIGHFRSTCRSELDYCRKCGVGVADIKQHLEKCSNKLSCVRCQGSHDASDVRCPNIKSYRSLLTKSLLSTAAAPVHKQNVHAVYHRNDPDFPVLSGNSNNSPYRTINPSINTGKKIDEMCIRMKHLDDNMNRLIDLSNKQLNQTTCIQQLSTKHEHQLHIQQTDISFQHDFISQFISPICQVLVEVIPVLVKQNTINNNTLLCPSLTSLCEKLSTDLPTWTNRFVQNENDKAKRRNEFNGKNQLNPVSSSSIVQHNPDTSNNLQPYPLNQ